MFAMADVMWAQLKPNLKKEGNAPQVALTLTLTLMPLRYALIHALTKRVGSNKGWLVRGPRPRGVPIGSLDIFGHF